MVTAAQRGELVRRRLLDAAVELIVERGWTAVTTRVVAERAGVAPGLVHYHFASVQALLAEAAVRAARDLTSRLAPLLGDTGSAEEALAVLLTVEEGVDPLAVLMVETYLAATRDERLRAAFAEVLAELRRDVADRLAAHRVADPAATAAALVAAIDGLVLHRALLRPADDEGTTAVLRRLLVPGADTSSGEDQRCR